MTATDELRRMLDERGVEWWQKKRHTCWKVGKGQEVEMWRAWEAPDGSITLKVDYIYHLTPEQAIAATLGRGECRNASKVMDEHGQARFACSECHAWIDSRLLWNPEYRNGESPWVSDCKLNFCPNCGRRIVGPTTNDADAEVAQ